MSIYLLGFQTFFVQITFKQLRLFYRSFLVIIFMQNKSVLFLLSPVDRDCRLYQLYLCRSVRLSQQVFRYDSKASDCEAPALEI